MVTRSPAVAERADRIALESLRVGILRTQGRWRGLKVVPSDPISVECIV